MIRRLLLIPGAPLLVPELSGGDAGAADVRAAVLSAAGRVLPGAGRPLIVRRPDDRCATAHAGSFRAWGAPVDVGAGHHLPELVARWVVRESGADPVAADVAAQMPDPCDAGEGPIIVVADGPAALTPRAPMTLIPDAAAVDDACAAIASGGAFRPGQSADPIGAFGPRLCDGVGLHAAGLWQDLAAFGAELAAEARRFDARAGYRAAPHGVGYHVAEWEWEL